MLVMTIALALSTQAAGKRKKIFSPSPGVLCDQYICADAQQGVSDKLTERYLGHAQVKNLRKMGKFNRQAFTLANGIHCDINDKKCYVDRYFDARVNIVRCLNTIRSCCLDNKKIQGSRPWIFSCANTAY